MHQFTKYHYPNSALVEICTKIISKPELKIRESNVLLNMSKQESKSSSVTQLSENLIPYTKEKIPHI